MPTPELKLQDLNDHIHWPVDVFLCSASFEARCRSITDRLDCSRVATALVAENADHRELHADQMTYLLGKFNGRGRPVMLDTRDPLKTGDGFQVALEAANISAETRILIDVTTFTHEALLILLRLVLQQCKPEHVQWVYATAGEYSVGDPPEKKWLSSGIREIRSVLGYPGEFLPSRKLHLIALVGFEHERVLELIRNYEPSVISLGYATANEAHFGDLLKVNKQRFQIVRSMYGAANEFSFPCYDPFETKRAIQQQVKLAPEMNVVFAALNTKPSTVGAGLAAMDNESIQLCYAQALLYNHRNYSTPGEFFYIYKFKS